MLMVRT